MGNAAILQGTKRRSAIDPLAEAVATKTPLLHAHEVSAMLAAFRRDSGGADSVTRAQLCATMCAMGATDPFLQLCVWRLFGGGEGAASLAFERFCASLATILRGTQTQRLACAFTAIDTDDDGLLTREDFEKILSSLPQQNDLQQQQQQSGEETAAEIFATVDADADGLVSLSDWVARAPLCPAISRALHGSLASS